MAKNFHARRDFVVPGPTKKRTCPAHDEPNDSDPPPTGKPPSGRAPGEYWIPSVLEGPRTNIGSTANANKRFFKDCVMWDEYKVPAGQRFKRRVEQHIGTEPV